MRVSIWFSSGKLLIPVGDGDKPISWLIEEFSRRFTKRESKPIIVKELQTKSGDSLDPADAIRDVVDDGAELVAITDGPESGRKAASTAPPEAPAPATVVAAAASVAKALVDEIEQRKAQEVHVCVQCGAKFKEAENGPGHCQFHAQPSEKRGWRTVWPCCSSDKPCKAEKHRSEHHQDFPYSEFGSFVQSTWKEIAQKWITESRRDFEDGWLINGDVAALKGGRLMLSVFRGAKCAMLRVIKPIDVEEQMTQCAAEKKRVVIARWTDPEVAGRFIEFAWVPAHGISMVYHLASDPVPTERVATFEVEKESLKLESLQTISEKPKYRFDSTATYALNPATHVGPEFPPYVPIETKTYECEGGSRLRMAQDGKTAANQDMGSREGKFGNYFITVVDLTNPSDEEISVVKARAEVKLGSAFVPADGVFLGIPDSRRGHYFPEDGIFPVRLEKRGAVKIAISVKVLVQGEPGRDNQTRARAHASLPQPLKVRMILEDVLGKTVSLVAEARSGGQGGEGQGLETRHHRVAAVRRRAFDDARLGGHVCLADWKPDVPH